jgi:hypothetical protein
MNFKSILLLISIVTLSECGILRTPKVYNALITTDDNLQPSRAFPVIQPVIQETGIAWNAPWNPYNLYDPYNNFQNAIIPSRFDGASRAQFPNEQQPQPQQPQQPPQPQQPQQEAQQEPQPEPLPENQTAAPSNVEATPVAQPEPVTEAPKLPENQQPFVPAEPSSAPEQRPADERSPIPLNEFGLPPSLVPLQTYTRSYPYSFPFLYDSFGNQQSFNQYPVLPPLSFVPQFQPNVLPPYQEQFFGMIAPQNPQSEQGIRNQLIPAAQVPNQIPEQEPVNNQQPESANNPPQPEIVPTISDSIKNNANKNEEIPDVPAPPLPVKQSRQ